MRNLLIAAAAMAAVSAPLAAQPGTDISVIAAPTAGFSIADLNLTSRHGQQALARRLAGAIEAVCGSYANAVELADQDRITDCRRSARAEADLQLANRPSAIRLASRFR